MTALITRESWGQWLGVMAAVVTSAIIATWILSGTIASYHDQDTKLIAYYHDLDAKAMSDQHDKDIAAMNEMNSRYMNALSDLSARMATQEAKTLTNTETEQRDYAEMTTFQGEMRSGLAVIQSQLGSLQGGISKATRSR